MGCAAVFTNSFPEVSWRKRPEAGCLRESLWPSVTGFSCLCNTFLSPWNILSPLFCLATSCWKASLRGYFLSASLSTSQGVVSALSRLHSDLGWSPHYTGTAGLLLAICLMSSYVCVPGLTQSQAHRRFPIRVWWLSGWTTHCYRTCALN